MEEKITEGDPASSKSAYWLAKALGDPEKRKSRGECLGWMSMGISFLILCFLSFILLWLGDHINASGMAVTRLLARAKAPVVAQFYPEDQRERIALVMYDQEFLDNNGAAWPISYSDHADWLLRLAGGEAKPKAILVDITFTQDREDPSLLALKEALCAITHEYKVPVFLAGLADNKSGRLRVRTGLDPDPGDGREPCFTLVGVSYEPDPVNRIAWQYPLTRHLRADGWQTGVAPDGSLPSYRSASLAMAQDAAGLDLGPETDPLALLWGYASSPNTDPPRFLRYCEPGVARWQMWIPGLFRKLWEHGPKKPVCPYHHTLSMAQVSALSDHDLATNIGGRFLIVGAAIPGYNDLVDSPIHGLIPGPYLHAMALDNLLTFKGEYKLSTDWSTPSPDLLAAALIAVFAVFLVHIVFACARAKILNANWIPSWLNGDSNDSHERPLRDAFVRTILWALRISFATIAAILVIAFLQKWFRIGMLPVVELATMTIAAEAADWLEKTRSYLARNTLAILTEIRIHFEKLKALFE